MVELLQPAVHPEGTEAETCNIPTANWVLQLLPLQIPHGLPLEVLHRALLSLKERVITQGKLHRRKTLVTDISNDSE